MAVDTQKLVILLEAKGVKLTKNELKSLDKTTKKAKKSFNAMSLAMKAMPLIGIALAVKKLGTMSAELEGVEKGFKSLAKSSGFTTDAFKKLQQATDGTVSKIDLMKQANNAMLLGISESEEQMADMFDVAQRLGSALGLDTLQAVESLTTGMGRQSKLMLDNLGIIVDTEKAYEVYGKSIGKSGSELTDAEKKLAFNNATMKEAKKLVAGLGEEQLTTKDALNQMATATIDMATKLGSFLSPALSASAKSFSSFALNVSDALDFAKTIDFKATASKIKANLSVIGQSMVESLGVIFDFIPELFQKAWKFAVNSVWPVLQEFLKGLSAIGQFLFEPLLIGAKIIGARISNIFIDVFNGLKEQYNKFADFFGMETIDLTNLFDVDALLSNLEGTSLIQTIIGSAEDNINTSQEMADALTDIWGTAFNQLVVLDEDKNKKIDKNNKKRTKSDEVASNAFQKIWKAQAEASKESVKSISASSVKAGMGYKNAGLAAQDAASQVIIAEVQKMVASHISSIFASTPFPFNLILAAGASAASGSLMQGAIDQVSKIKFAADGMDEIVTQPTPIIAGEAGPEQVTITPLGGVGGDAPSGGGGITVNLSGNILTQDFVEGELAEAISEAVRRGNDFGMA